EDIGNLQTQDHFGNQLAVDLVADGQLDFVVERPEHVAYQGAVVRHVAAQAFHEKQGFDLEDIPRLGVVGDLDQEVDDGAQALAAGGGAGGRFAYAGFRLVAGALAKAFEQYFLGREIAVKGAASHAGNAADIAHRQVVQSLTGCRLHGGIENAGDTLLRPCGAGFLALNGRWLTRRRGED